MIKDILIAQKQELDTKFKEQYVKREFNSDNLSNQMIKVIIGPRRAGKSFFALHFLNKLEKFGYVNFDDEQLTEIKEYDSIVEAMNTVYNNPKYLLFDEIQNLPKWELFANRLQRQGYNILITGSNANLLSKELATHLTGRHLLINILPFSFKEYLQTLKKELTSHQIKEKLGLYLINGGYPEPLIKNIGYKEYLSTLFDSIVYKDIVKRYNIRSPQGIEELSYYLLSNSASEYSYNNLSKMIKLHGINTIKRYISYLEESFIFFSVKRFSTKVKEQITSMKKIYSIDNGFIYAKAFKVSESIGKLYENLVAQELKRKELNNLIKFFYWKNTQQEEVDFVIQEGIEVKQLIQVCYDIENIKTKKREINALLKASKELKCPNLLLITADYESEEQIEWFGFKGKVKFIPLWKWLLSQ